MLEYSINNTGLKLQKPKKKINKKVLFVFGILLISSIIFIRQNIKKTAQIESEPDALAATNLQENQMKKNPSPTFVPAKTSKELIESIKSATPIGSGTYSVYIKSLASNQEFGINEQMIFTGASLNKLPILAVLYYKVDKGDIDLDKLVILQKEDIQDYGTGSIRYTNPGTPFSYRTLARLMIQQSDNTAAHLLGNLIIGMDSIQSQIEEWGLNQTDMVMNKTSPKDISILLEKIYKGEIANKALTLEMLQFMTHTDFEDRITLGIPENVPVHHKIGDEIGFVHDAAIVDIPNNPYILTVMTSEITDEDGAKKNIADISKKVYEFMKR